MGSRLLKGLTEPSFFTSISEKQQEIILQQVEEKCRSHLYREGIWYADYRRLRILAIKNI